MPNEFYRFYHRSVKCACPDLNGLCPRPSICSSTKYAIMKNVEGDEIFSRSFWNFEKSITFLFRS